MASYISALGCTCGGPRQTLDFHPYGSYWGADVVFNGLVDDITVKTTVYEGKEYPSSVIVSFAVEEAFRNVAGKTLEIYTSPSGGMCGYPFQKGKRYFVYARRNKENQLTEHLCGPTVPLENAQAADRDPAV
ncbi:MAG: hypothetical protein ABI954_10320, partial [Pyrinomonadaceae bacterium]